MLVVSNNELAECLVPLTASIWPGAAPFQFASWAEAWSLPEGPDPRLCLVQAGTSSIGTLFSEISAKIDSRLLATTKIFVICILEAPLSALPPSAPFPVFCLSKTKRRLLNHGIHDSYSDEEFLYQQFALISLLATADPSDVNEFAAGAYYCPIMSGWIYPEAQFLKKELARHIEQLLQERAAGFYGPEGFYADAEGRISRELTFEFRSGVAADFDPTLFKAHWASEDNAGHFRTQSLEATVKDAELGWNRRLFELLSAAQMTLGQALMGLRDTLEGFLKLPHPPVLHDYGAPFDQATSSVGRICDEFSEGPWKIWRRRRLQFLVTAAVVAIVTGFLWWLTKSQVVPLAGIVGELLTFIFLYLVPLYQFRSRYRSFVYRIDSIHRSLLARYRESSIGWLHGHFAYFLHRQLELLLHIQTLLRAKLDALTQAETPLPLGWAYLIPSNQPPKALGLKQMLEPGFDPVIWYEEVLNEVTARVRTLKGILGTDPESLDLSRMHADFHGTDRLPLVLTDDAYREAFGSASIKTIFFGEAHVIDQLTLPNTASRKIWRSDKESHLILICTVEGFMSKPAV